MTSPQHSVGTAATSDSKLYTRQRYDRIQSILWYYTMTVKLNSSVAERVMGLIEQLQHAVIYVVPVGHTDLWLSKYTLTAVVLVNFTVLYGSRWM